MSEEMNTQNTEQQPTTQPADNGNQGGSKMFTQEEVNQIIRERLARERAKNTSPEPTEEEKQQQAMEQRMKDLSTRENRFECRSYVADRRLPAELLDLFDTSDFNEFVRKVDTFMGVVQRTVGAAPLYTHEDPGDANATPAGFAVTKHTPRQYPPFRDC